MLPTCETGIRQIGFSIAREKFTPRTAEMTGMDWKRRLFLADDSPSDGKRKQKTTSP